MQLKVDVCRIQPDVRWGQLEERLLIVLSWVTR